MTKDYSRKTVTRRGMLRAAGVLSAALACALAVGALAGCTSSNEPVYRTLDQIKDSGKIVIGVFSDKHPFGYVDSQGEYQGYDIELARQLAKDLGVDVELVSTEAANRVEFLKSGKVDLVLANFTVTAERAEVVDFAESYMNVALGAVSHAGNVVTDLAKVGSDVKVMVISGTTAETYITKNYPDLYSQMQKFETYAACKTAFENNENAVWVNDNTEVIAFAQGKSDYVVGIESLGDADTIAPAVSKGNATLLEWINEDMKALGAKNFFHDAYDKTLAEVYGSDYKETLVIEPK